MIDGHATHGEQYKRQHKGTEEDERRRNRPQRLGRGLDDLHARKPCRGLVLLQLALLRLLGEQFVVLPRVVDGQAKLRELRFLLR